MELFYAFITPFLESLENTFGFDTFLRYGGSTAQLELTVLIMSMSLAIGFLAVFLMMGRSSRQIRKLQNNSQELTSGIRGKLERLEQEFNQLKSTQIRNQEINADKLAKIAEVLEQIKKKRLNPADTGLIDLAGDLEDSQHLNLDQLVASATDLNKTETIILETPAESLSEEILAPLEEKLAKTRTGLFGKIKSLFSTNSTIDLADLDQIEELLVSADLGVKTSLSLIEETRRVATGEKDLSLDRLLSHTKQQVKQILIHNQQEEFPITPQDQQELFVVLVIGVNGVGKTTTVAKLASKWAAAGKKVTMAAADTFRAAAVEQLLEWGKRLDVPVVQGDVNAKPATVVFEAIDQALKNKSDILIIDTAGRLHNKANLMQELEGIGNVIQKKLNRSANETILVVDGATGQNALQQAKEFNQIIPLTGVIVTKLDGTPKGGIVVAIKSELNIPIRYIGVGESANDLRVFNASEFTEAIFS